MTDTLLLEPEGSPAAETRVLGRAGRITPGSLREAINQAVMEVAPEGEEAAGGTRQRGARVERWGEDSGNGALAGRELPPAAVLATDQRITWWARQLRKAGLDGDMDRLRARAYLDRLWSPAPTRRGGGAPHRAPTQAPGCQARPAGHPAGPVAGGVRRERVNLTVPLATTLGLADRPG